MRTCLIVSGGDINHINNSEKYDFVIACDAGYDNCLRNKLKPDLIIGDFDSYPGNIDEDNKGIKLMKYPVKKDDSDTMLAVKYAIDGGYEKIVITCALGGRLDHTMANIQALTYISDHGLSCELFSDTELITVVSAGIHTFPRLPGHSLSLFALTNEVKGINISGSKYNVTGVTLYKNDPMGLSNEWVSDTVCVSFTEGTLLVIQSAVPSH